MDNGLSARHEERPRGCGSRNFFQYIPPIIRFNAGCLFS